ncbi:MAG: hypothetical protein SPK71_01215 [Prevotella sp.]|nr:hypothetical protein [Prevotella sp.]
MGQQLARGALIKNAKVISWLEAYFVVPEGKQATLSWTGLNSSEDWFDFMEQLSFNDGTRIKIDGETIGDYCGRKHFTGFEKLFCNPFTSML